MKDDPSLDPYITQYSIICPKHTSKKIFFNTPKVLKENVRELFLQFRMEKTFMFKSNDPTTKKDCSVDYFNIVHFCLKVAINNVKRHVTDWNKILAT